MAVWNDFQETKARSGAGSGLYRKVNGKYQLLLPTIETPFVTTETSDIEIKVSTSSVVTKLDGIETLQNAETTFYVHRDTINVLEEINGQTLDLMSVGSDFVGYKYSGIIKYTPSNSNTDDAWEGTLTIIPKSKPTYVENAFSLLRPTAHFASAIDGVVTVGVGKKYEISITTNPSDATVSVTSDTTGDKTATATISDGTLTITGVASGSRIVTLTSAKTDYASWTTTVLVIVE